MSILCVFVGRRWGCSSDCSSLSGWRN